MASGSAGGAASASRLGKVKEKDGRKSVQFEDEPTPAEIQAPMAKRRRVSSTATTGEGSSEVKTDKPADEPGHLKGYREHWFK